MKNGFFGIPNPFVSYETLADAARAAGFEMDAPDTVKSYDETSFQVMNNQMVQVIFSNADSRLIIRKASGDEDISGDYNVYTKTQEVDVNGISVTMKGNDETVQLATWTDKGYTYAVTSGTAMTLETMTDLVSQVK